MAAYVLYAHGSRDAGTADGTYIVPPGITVYFYALDSEILYEGGAARIKNLLLKSNPDELGAQGWAREVKKKWDKIPNYTATGDSSLPDPTGVYLVGQPKSGGPVTPIGNGYTRRISDIIGGAGKGGVIGTALYWLACRASPDNWNVTDDAADLVTSQIQGSSASVRERGTVSGLKPSQVKARGGIWR